MSDSLFRHKEMDTWKGRLIDKSPLTGRIWNIDPAGHEEGLALLLLLIFAFFFYLEVEVKSTHTNPFVIWLKLILTSRGRLQHVCASSKFVSQGKSLFVANQRSIFCPSRNGSDSLFFPQVGVQYTK